MSRREPLMVVEGRWRLRRPPTSRCVVGGGGGQMEAEVGPFFIFVGLHWPSLAAVGLRGLRSNKKMKNKM